jgi:hypothetical protein
VSEILKRFVDIQRNSVENLYPGSWPVYGDYDLVEYEEGGERHIYVVRSDLDPQQTCWYSPLREPVLFVEFAELFDRTTASEEAAPTVLDWVKRYGALGANRAYAGIESSRGAWPPPEGVQVKVHGTPGAGRDYPFMDSLYSSTDGSPVPKVWPPPDDIQWVDEFVSHAQIANLCWRLLKALKARGGPDADELRELLRWLGLEYDETPARRAIRAKSVVDQLLDIHLSRETCIRRHHLGERKSGRRIGFVSLLGALYLQMSNFRDAEEITYCKFCGDPIDFEKGEDLPSDALKGTRGKHRTHSNREYCKEKYGKTDYCRNQFNYQRRKKAREGS